MTLTHPDPVTTTAPPSPGELALTLTAVHAAAMSGDLDGYTDALSHLYGQTRACLHAVGGLFTCDACDTPIGADQLATAPPTPAGRLAQTAPAMPAGEQTRAQQQAAALRVMADIIEALPAVSLRTHAWGHWQVNVHEPDTGRPPIEVAYAELAGFQAVCALLDSSQPVEVSEVGGNLHLTVYHVTWRNVILDVRTILDDHGFVHKQARAWAAEWNATRR